jgi:hypothetical protein
MRNRIWLLGPVMLAGLALWSAPLPGDDKKIDPYDQSGVDLEKQPTDARLKKIVLVAGRQSHGPGDHEFFAGCAILMKMLRQTPGVFPVMARDGWPTRPETFDKAAAVVFYMDGGNRHPILDKGRKEVVQKLIDDKAGFVNLHYAVEYPKSQSEHIFQWLGGYYETGFSTNPHWDADFKTLPEHAITRGVKPFKIRDEWYFNIRFKPESKDVTPILESTPPDGVRRTKAAQEHKGRKEVVAWAFERPAAAALTPASTGALGVFRLLMQSTQSCRCSVSPSGFSKKSRPFGPTPSTISSALPLPRSGTSS